MDNLAQTEATKQRAHWMVSLENNLAITIKFLNSEHPHQNVYFQECILQIYLSQHLGESLNVFVPTELVHWILTPERMTLGGETFRKWSDQKEWALMNGSRALVNGSGALTKRAQICHRRTEQEDKIYEPGSGPSQNTSMPGPWSWILIF